MHRGAMQHVRLQLHTLVSTLVSFSPSMFYTFTNYHIYAGSFFFHVTILLHKARSKSGNVEESIASNVEKMRTCMFPDTLHNLMGYGREVDYVGCV